MTTFKELGLSENFLKTIEGLKYTEPTEIQEKTIPLTLEGKDNRRQRKHDEEASAK